MTKRRFRHARPAAARSVSARGGCDAHPSATSFGRDGGHACRRVVRVLDSGLYVYAGRHGENRQPEGLLETSEYHWH
jgi:hypothetical protein